MKSYSNNFSFQLGEMEYGGTFIFVDANMPFTVGLNTGWLVCYKISPFGVCVEGGGGGVNMPFTVG